MQIDRTMQSSIWNFPSILAAALSLWVAAVPLYDAAEEPLAIPVEVHCNAQDLWAACSARADSGPCSEAPPEDCPLVATCTVLLTFGHLSMLATDTSSPGVLTRPAELFQIRDESAASRTPTPLVPPPQFG